MFTITICATIPYFLSTGSDGDVASNSATIAVDQQTGNLYIVRTMVDCECHGRINGHLRDSARSGGDCL